MPLRLALATPDLRRLQAAWAAAATGGWAFMVALAVYAYGEGGAAAVGVAALARMVPAGLAAPLLGRVADRRSRRDVLLASTLARAALLGTLALAAALHAFPLVLVLAALFTVAQAAHKPAQAALIPRLSAHAEAVQRALDHDRQRRVHPRRTRRRRARRHRRGAHRLRRRRAGRSCWRPSCSRT